MRIAAAEIYRYALPLKQPMQIAGAQLEERRGFLLRLTSDEGAVGWGDAAPLPGFGPATLEGAWNGLLRAVRPMPGKPLPESSRSLAALDFLKQPEARPVSFAIEAALLGLRASAEGRMPCEFLAESHATEIAINALLMGDASGILPRARALAAEGYQAAKLKVGRAPMGSEVQLVEALREALGGGVALRLDANRAWDFDEALRFLRAVSDCGIAYIEEPLAEPYRLPELRDATGVPYAVDESLLEFGGLLGEDAAALPARSRAEAFRAKDVIDNAAALVWKPTIHPYPSIAGLGQDGVRYKGRVVVSAAFESGVGIAALANYAAAYAGGLPVGLDTYRCFADDVLAAPLPFEGPAVSLAGLNAAATQVNTGKLDLVWEG